MTFPEPWTAGHLDVKLLAERNQYIIDRVQAGTHDPITWIPITTAARGHRGTFYVSSDALKIDGVRVEANALTAQRIADLLGAALNTTRTSDLAWEACVPPLVPQELGGTPDMESTAKMLEHSKLVDKAANGRTGLLRTVGKDWVIHKYMAAKPATQAINYGWQWSRAATLSYSGVHVVQGVGTRHNTLHEDYSQTLCFVRADMLVDGVSKPFDEVLRDPELAWLVNDDGSLQVTRYRLPTDPPPKGEVPKQLTPVDELDLARALAVPGNPNRQAVAWAHVAHENGRGRAIWNFNLGNVSAGATWTGDYFELPTKPPDATPTMNFRAFPDLTAGVAGYWSFLESRYPTALARFDAGDPVGAVHELKVHGYFTAAEGAYANDVLLLFREFETSIRSRL